jgi:uncharacterized protein (TIGR02594 family)
MRVKFALMLAAGSACLLSLCVADWLYSPPRVPVEAQPAASNAGKQSAVTDSAVTPGVLLPLEARLPPSRPSQRAISQAVPGGLALIAEARKYLNTNPTHRSRLWCAAFMNFILAKLGYPGTHSDLARSFVHYGRRISGPRIGAIAVLSRGKEGGHVGIVTGVDKHGNPILISGNFNRRVGIGVHPRSRVLAYVVPPGTPRIARGSHPAEASVARTLSRSLSASRTHRRHRHHHYHHYVARKCQRSDTCRRIARIGLNAAAAQARAEARSY